MVSIQQGLLYSSARLNPKARSLKHFFVQRTANPSTPQSLHTLGLGGLGFEIPCQLFFASFSVQRFDWYHQDQLSSRPTIGTGGVIGSTSVARRLSSPQRGILIPAAYLVLAWLLSDVHDRLGMGDYSEAIEPKPLNPYTLNPYTPKPL